MDPTDEQLIARMAGGDEQALRELHGRYARYFYALARRILGPHGDHEEHVQDAFMNAWRAAGRFDPSIAGAKTWLVTIAQRRLLQARRDRPRETLPLEEWDAPTPAGGQLDRIMVERAVDVLEPDQRRLIELAFFQGHSHQEVADLTGVPLGTVKTRIRSALARMREHLERAAGPANRAQEGGKAP